MDDVAAVKSDDFFDILVDSFNLDDFDFDLAADEFCDAYAAFVADPYNKSRAASPGGWLAGSAGINDGSGGEGLPDSGVTDGPLAGEGEGSGSLSAFVCDLERFLLENNDDVVVDDTAACPDGEEAKAEELIRVDDYFGDLLDFGDGIVAAAADDAAGKENDADEEESLAAREDEEPTSRKRARHKIRGTTILPCPWGELEVTRHLALMQVLPALWLPASAAPALRCV